jgi:tetratricopeptide (TPR) repeat protein
MSEISLSQNAAADPVVPRPQVRRAIGPRLRLVFYVVLTLLAAIGANSLYLSGVTALQFWTEQTYEDYFYQCMFGLHILLGLLIVVPFLVFGLVHMRNTRNRRIRRTVMIGYVLFAVCVVVLVTGFLLLRQVLDLKNPAVRAVIYWLHVGGPLVAGWLYWMHRLVGPKMRWKSGLVWGGIAAGTAAGMVLWQYQDPREWNVRGPQEGEQYYFPSLARTSTGNFISAEVLDMNEYCLECHQDTHSDWALSAHHFSSFNNPAYLASVAETREVGFERDGNVTGSRFCAGCHDPVPFFSGAFDDPEFDMLNHPTSQSGITCTVCHAITHVNSKVGNADYTIEEPVHYPFAGSDNAVLKWINHQLVKAKPSFHRRTFLKPLHQTSEFCGACHKVHLPFALNHYKEWLRGQNHYDSWLLSGVSGHGARSFYYPETAQTDCNGCHMPKRESDDFGAKVDIADGRLKVHDHFFPSANSGINWMTGNEDAIRRHEKMLEGTTRVDLFGIRSEGTLDGTLTAPLRPQVPELQPGEKYLLETVVRTLKLGHHFTQGTTDSNEVWLEVMVSDNDGPVGHSGLIQDDGHVDPWSHFINNFMLDRDGNRIDRRNAQDIFVPLYQHQIAPGSAQTLHYSFRVPERPNGPITARVRLLYRKFDQTYMEFVDRRTTELGRPVRGHQDGQTYHNQLPVIVMAEDQIVFPVAGSEAVPATEDRGIDEWERWNDYGIGMLTKGKAELRQAMEAFRRVEELGVYHGPLNLARALVAEAGAGQLDQAAEALQRTAEFQSPAAPPWTIRWLSGVINRQQGQLADAEENFRQVLNYRTEETVRRKFDFSRDYVVNNLLGQTVFDRAQQIRGSDPESQERRRQRLLEAVAVFQRTLAEDPENVDAHYNLFLLHQQLGQTEQAEAHQAAHERYRMDNTARGEAVTIARKKYPAADFAAESLVIYDLQREDVQSPGDSETQRSPGDAD